MLEKEEIPSALPLRGQHCQIETFTEDALYCTANLSDWSWRSPSVRIWILFSSNLSCQLDHAI